MMKATLITVKGLKLKPFIVKLFLFIFFIVSSSVTIVLAQGDTQSTAIAAGNFGECGGNSYTDSRYVGGGSFSDDYGNASSDIYYKLTVLNTTQLNIQTCYSNFDTKIYLLNSNGAQVTVGSPSSCSMRGEITSTVPAGIYYIVVEEENGGYLDVLYLYINSLPTGTSLQAGDLISTAIDAGTILAASPYSNTINLGPTNCYQNNNGMYGADVYYKFTLTEPAQVTLSNCGSAIPTLLSCVDSNGDWYDGGDISGPACPGQAQSLVLNYEAGVHYLWIEAMDDFNQGDVTTTISIGAPVSNPNNGYPGIDCPTNSSTIECIPLASAFSHDKNYIVTTIVRRPGFKHTMLDSRRVGDLRQSVQYFDGIGRPLQNVQLKGSPDATKDLVQPFAYDHIGREVFKYLPYAAAGTANGAYKHNALTSGQGLDQFYNPSGSYGSQLPNGVAKITSPYSETVFEQGAPDLAVEQGAPGPVWQVVNSHTLKIEYGTNASSEVRLWVINGAGATGTNYYEAGQLLKTTAKDENWQPTDGKTGTNEEFKNKQGLVVLKRIWKSESESLSTYYVYDEYNNLRYVIPPAINENGEARTSFIEDDASFTSYIYAYHYDDLNRLLEKKIPGKGWEYMVYNKLDQLVLSQDANQRANGHWFFSKYDAQGRTIMTGLVSSSLTRTAWQANIDGQGHLWETRDNVNASGTNTGYTNVSLPISGLSTYNSISYYDDYSFYSNGFNPSITVSTVTTGLVTGTRVNILGTGTMLLSVNYYDDEGRIVHSKSENHLGGTDVVNSTYNFVGELTERTRIHVANSTTTTIFNTYVYDHMGRRVLTKENINGQGEITLTKLEYNDIGQLIAKKLHGSGGTDPSGFLYESHFTYNERGWLKSQTSPQFSMELKYNDGTTPQYNGNISNQLWGTGSSLANTFTYSYDKLNRLTNGTSTGIVMSEALTYDIMGNIASLNRDNAGANLYTYTGNQLQSVANVTAANYVYDANGNATTDGRNNKTITYNVLNLPQTVSGGLNYTYDAAGQKLKRVNTVTNTTTDYVNGVQYSNGAIDFIQTEEGVARRNGTTYRYEYNLADHLGNTRVTFYKNPTTNQLEVLQRDDYYAFGKQRSVISNTNKYLYNGKEIQEELGGQYDYGFRFYDPVIARFTTVDPMSDSRTWLSPYNYVQNNPILRIDPTGALDHNYDIYDDGTITVQRTEDATNTYTYHKKGGETVDLGTYEKNKDTNLTNLAANTSGKSPFVLDNNNGKTYLDGDFAAGVLGGAQDYKDQTGNTAQITQLTNSEGIHSGHGGSLGQYADIRYANNKGDQIASVWTSGTNYDQNNSQILADSFRKFGFNGPASILTENAAGTGPALKNTLFVNGEGKFHHKHHMHLQRLNYQNFGVASTVPAILRPITPYSKPFTQTIGIPFN